MMKKKNVLTLPFLVVDKINCSINLAIDVNIIKIKENCYEKKMRPFDRKKPDFRV